uniref:Uncharacterized protein n=1 Tax=Meloidogyne enterolobii TaxID=390850 RepID=A0A6V7X352_MELEN|nr:unnamed protein product [Meloidogyne enterolobii]
MKALKLSIFLFLCLSSKSSPVGSLSSDDETNEQHHFDPFQLRNDGPYGTGTSETG